MDGIIQSLKSSTDENAEPGNEVEEADEKVDISEEVNVQASEDSVSAIDSMLADQGGDLTAIVKALSQHERKTRQRVDRSANIKESDPTLMNPKGNDKSEPSPQQSKLSQDVFEPSTKVDGDLGIDDPKMDSSGRRKLDKLEASKKVDGTYVLSPKKQDLKLNPKRTLAKSGETCEPSTNVEKLYPDKQENENPKLDSDEGRYPKRRLDKMASEGTKRKLPDRKIDVFEDDKEDKESQLKQGGRKRHKNEEVDEPHTRRNSKASKGRVENDIPRIGRRMYLLRNKQCSNSSSSACGETPLIILDSGDDFE